MKKDYYKILGIDKNATDLEIKKAYRKEAIKWHPDKWTGASEEEKKTAENNFKELQEAYSCLSDPNKRSNYDRFGTADSNEFNFDPFEWFFDQKEKRRYRKPKASTIQVNIGISIEEIYKGFNKTIYFNNTKRCSKCGGKQGEGMKICPNCHGSGMVSEINQTPFGIIQSTTECPNCHGSGKVFEKVCTQCHGSGVETVRDSLYIKQDGIIFPGTTKIFERIGVQDKDPSVEDGDIIVKFIPNLDDKYYMEGYDVYEKVKVDILDCLLGCKKILDHPSGTKIELRIPECCKDGSKLLIKGKGLTPGSNYIYVINQDMPEKLTEEQKEILNKLKNYER